QGGHANRLLRCRGRKLAGRYADRAPGALQDGFNLLVIGRRILARGVVAVLDRGQAPPQRRWLHALLDLVGKEGGNRCWAGWHWAEALRHAPCREDAEIGCVSRSCRCSAG